MSNEDPIPMPQWGRSMFERGLGEWQEPERLEGHQTPSERRKWRLYCAYDRQHHDAIKAEYEATKGEGQGFVVWAQERINRQMSERMDALYMDMLPRKSDGPFVHISKR